ncbi:DEAD/DEAH box helicase [Archangium violaceum]|uniref:DEAD/DEAH box helicase n=1 Tax=Archangium violaceum TaxID=83451 RepID=UPI00193B241E|nr:helicase-related protein [Archangium violaceum]QRK05244.1 DEAD/DEAH box helicase [Archangium violaceum]
MEAEERDRVERVLSRIPREDWEKFLASANGNALRNQLDAVRAALRQAGHLSPGLPPRPIAEVIDLLGHRLLGDDTTGEWLRWKILETLPETQWQRLADAYPDMAGKGATAFHGNMSQGATGSRVLAGYWRQGTKWARTFCDVTGLPEVLAQARKAPFSKDEEILPVEPLTPLHPFQVEVYKSLRKLILDGQGKAAMMSLPTGAGKTRVTVEAICDHFALETNARRNRNIVLWISQSDELQQQAWECFRQVWQVPPHRAGETIRRNAPLRIVRLWGGRDPDEIELSEEPTVLIAGIDQLATWARDKPEFFERIPTRRIACVVVDEAHSLITHEHREVLLALGLRAKHEWRTLQGAPPVIGLSATPWRTRGEETATLRKYFQARLVRPDSLGSNPITALQKMGILAKVKPVPLRIEGTRPMSEDQRQQYERFKELPLDYLEQLGFEPERNARIIKALSRLPTRSQVLVFACSVAHANLLTVALNRAFGDESAAVVTGQTPRTERASVIERFRDGSLRFLCNVGVLTTGFDAPKADVVCVTRPTTSAIRYEQMVGRGLRGPKNGGTDWCTVLDVQDEGLPDDVKSYARVLALWEKRSTQS